MPIVLLSPASRSRLVALAAGVLLFSTAAGAQPTLADPGLRVATVVAGLAQPTGLAFLAANDFFVIEKASGRVKRVVNGVVAATSLDLAVNSHAERGLLGIALDPAFAANHFVYLFWTESSTGADSTAATEVPLLGTRIDRFTWNAGPQTLVLERNLIRLRALQNDQNDAQAPGAFTPQGDNNGGKLAIGPDGKLYAAVGDVGRRGWMQNLQNGPSIPPGPDDQFGGPAPDNAHLSGAVLRLNLDGTTPADNPFFAAGAGIGGEVGANVQRVFSYGHRAGFGLAFDPATGNLWNSEVGDDAFDEINKVTAGGNYGWVQAMGPIARVAEFKAIETNMFTPGGATTGALAQLRYPVSRVASVPATAQAGLFGLPGAAYRDPELSWRYSVAPSGLGFVNGTRLGTRYNGTLWSGQATTTAITGGGTGPFAGGALMALRLTLDRQHLDLTADARLADRVADNGAMSPPPPGTPAGTAGYKFDGRESETLLIGQGFGVVADLTTGPDQALYVVSRSANAVYRIFRNPTAPVVVPHVSGTRGGNGIYTSNVVVSWSVTDTEFGLVPPGACATVNLTADTPGTTLTCTATNTIGLTTTVPITIRIDQHFTDVPAIPGTLGPIPDATVNNVPGVPRDVKFNVTGMPHVGNVAVSFTLNPAHTWAGDLTATLIAPDGTAHILFQRPASGNDLAGPYVFRDAATDDFRAAVTVATPVPAGTFRTSVPAGLTAMNPVLASGRNGNGTWTLRFTDSALLDVGTVAAATLSLAPSLPSNLRVDSVTGNLVQLRWDAPAGVTPTGYVVEGGVVPDVMLASFPTGIAAPIAVFAAPTGSFWVRVRAVEGAVQSLPSTDTRLIVDPAVPPSPPANVTAGVVGTTLHLSWRNTFAGGPPTAVVLDVTGSLSGSLPIGPSGQLAIPGVPGGTYNLSLRAANAAGVSAATSPIAVTIPTACSGAPNPPVDFLFYRVGNTVSLLWDPPASGPAPSSYIVEVSGAVAGSIPVPVRTLSAPVPPGVYTVRVSAANACGVSAPTASQTVTVP